MKAKNPVTIKAMKAEVLSNFGRYLWIDIGFCDRLSWMLLVMRMLKRTHKSGVRTQINPVYKLKICTVDSMNTYMRMRKVHIVRLNWYLTKPRLSLKRRKQEPKNRRA